MVTGPSVASENMRNHFRIALYAGLSMGTLVGAVDGLLTLSRNIYAPHFALFCILAPLPLTAITAGVLAMPLAAVWWLRRAAVEASIPRMVGALTALIAMLWGATWWQHVAAEAWQTGASRVVLGLTLMLVLALAAATGLATYGLLRNLDHHRLQRGLRWTTRAALLLNLTALVVIGWTAFNEGRRFLYDWQRGQPRQPGELNVVLITLDTLRADRLAAFGGARGLTPALDRLASSGTTFLTAISQSPWTMPSLASMLTGLTPDAIGAGRSTNAFDVLARTPLPSHLWYLPDALRAQGYLTQAFVTNPFLSMRYGFARGFDRYQNATMASEAFIALDHTLTLSVLTALWPRFAISDIGETVTGRAEAWLTRHRSEKFFLWLHYIDIHAPYGDPRRLGNKTFRGDHRTLDGKAAAGPSDGSLGDRFVHIARLRAGEIQLNPDQRQELMALYDAGVRYDDEQVGHVLERLEQLDLRAHTVIVVASDHGEEFWEHGGVEHGHTVYEELVRVPLIIAHPDGTPGQRIDAVVRLMDVAPTVADLTGMAAPPALDGRSLRPLLNGDADAPRLALSEALLFADEKRALRTAGLKYIVSANGKQELYDLANDPAELRDLAARDDLLAKQRTLLHNLLAAHETPQAAPRTVDATTRQRLHTLGYGQ